MLMELVGELQFLNEYGESKTVKPVDWAEESEGEALISVAGMVLIVSLLAILFIFTGKMAWSAVFALMVGYGHQGQWWRRQWRQEKHHHLGWLH